MKAQIIYDAQGRILGVINVAALATDKGTSAYVPNPGEHHAYSRSHQRAGGKTAGSAAHHAGQYAWRAPGA
jgi:hypothetical protein